MNRDEIESAVALAIDADTTHEDARDFYGNYGWHLTTENAGDVCLQAVEYDWLDAADDCVVRTLLGSDADLSQDEAESIVEMARTVREAGESICALLDEASEAYEAGNLDECRKALLSAYSQESVHGDTPATRSLAGKLLVSEADALVCGNQVQQDHSGGQGHAWRNVVSQDIPANIVLEIECEMIDGGKDECEDYVASNGQHYRW